MLNKKNRAGHNIQTERFWERRSSGYSYSK